MNYFVKKNLTDVLRSQDIDVVTKAAAKIKSGKDPIEKAVYAYVVNELGLTNSLAWLVANYENISKIEIEALNDKK